MGRLIGVLFFSVSKRRRHVVFRNIEACFPGMSAIDQKSLVRGVFVDSGIGIVESSWVWFGNPDRLSIYLDKASSNLLGKAVDSGNGVLILCPHYTTLEISSYILNQIVGRSVITYRPQQSAILEAAICAGRTRYGDLINVRDVRSIVSSLKDGRVVWFGPDQDMGAHGSVFSEFFGVPACTVKTPARLARMTRCSVFFCTLLRHSGSYHATFQAMADSYPRQDEVWNADELNKLIENAIKQAPTQYMWTHRRFKTNPDGTRHSFYQ